MKLKFLRLITFPTTYVPVCITAVRKFNFLKSFKVSSAWLSWAFEFKGLQNRSGMEFDSNYTWIYPKKFASWCSSNKAGGRRSKFCSFFCLSWVFSPVHSLFSFEPRRGSVQSSGKEKTCADHARSTISLCMVETSDLS